jgi:hypothetical protein
MLPLRLRVYVSIFICVLLGGTIGLMVVENLPAFDAFYFVIVTIATVGYGDIHPLTSAGKLVVILIIVTGVGCFIGVAANSIEYVIDERERKIRMEKLNMIIGIFFSEVGTTLLKRLSAADPAAGEIRSALVVSGSWTEADFFHARAVIANHNSVPDTSLSLPDLHAFLMEHKGFLLALLENPQLIEHDSFTPLLQALFHLTEELMSRERLSGLPPADHAHLAGDINRVYHLLLIEWITYMHALSRRYPYLFSLAMRRNPFDRDASVIVS